jgi:hypothetical protein
LIGAVARLAVAVSFLVYVSHRAGSWWGGGHQPYGLIIISAVAGLIIGGAGGATCRPILGAVLGGALSAAFCLGLFVLPVNAMLSMSGRGHYPEERTEILVRWVAMTMAGAIAGWAGATVGRRGRIGI